MLALARGPDADLSASKTKVLARYIGLYKNDDDNFATCFLYSDRTGLILLDGDAFGAAPVRFRIGKAEAQKLEAALSKLPPDSSLAPSLVDYTESFPQTTVRFKDKDGHFFYTRTPEGAAATGIVSDICNMDPTDPH
jgi:hypothetical protein